MPELGKNLYEVLGVEQNAQNEDIESAYKELAFQYHPDRNPSRIADELLKLINEAYSTLKDIESRKRYDRTLNKPTTKTLVTESVVKPQEGVQTSINYLVAIVSVIFGFAFGILWHPAAGLVVALSIYTSKRIFGLALTAGVIAIVAAIALFLFLKIQDSKAYEYQEGKTYGGFDNNTKLGGSPKLANPETNNLSILNKKKEKDPCAFLKIFSFKCKGDRYLAKPKSLITPYRDTRNQITGCIQSCGGNKGNKLVFHGQYRIVDLLGEIRLEGRFRKGKIYGRTKYYDANGNFIKTEPSRVKKKTRVKREKKKAKLKTEDSLDGKNTKLSTEWEDIYNEEG